MIRKDRKFDAVRTSRCPRCWRPPLLLRAKLLHLLRSFGGGGNGVVSYRFADPVECILYGMSSCVFQDETDGGSCSNLHYFGLSGATGTVRVLT